MQQPVAANGPHEGQLRVWHLSNPPGKPLWIYTKSVDEAIVVLDSLAMYDLYLGDIIECNAQGLEIFDDGDWEEWQTDDGDDIRAIQDQRGSLAKMRSNIA